MMQNWNQFKNNPKALRSVMAAELKQGNLMLVLGAGASASVGLPNWITLINKCIYKSNQYALESDKLSLLDNDASLNDVLLRTSSLKATCSEEEYITLVKDSLYEDINESAKPLTLQALVNVINSLSDKYEFSPIEQDASLLSVTRKLISLVSKLGQPFFLALIRELHLMIGEFSSGYQNLLKNDLLISIGALVMGTKRGSISDVITYNFDDVLEWYLSLHGFVVDIVTEPYSITNNVDVTIYHPHGFLPFNEKFTASNSIVFDKESFEDRIGNERESPWRDRLRILLSTKKPIFIGLSGDDPTFGPMLRSFQKEVQDRDVVGYWFRKRPEKHNKDQELDDKNKKIVPIYFDDYSEIPEFLLEISQIAAN